MTSQLGAALLVAALILTGCGASSSTLQPGDPGVPFDPNVIVSGPAPGEYSPPTSCRNPFAGPYLP